MPRWPKDFWPTPNAYPQSRANTKLPAKWRKGWPRTWSPNLIDKAEEWSLLRDLTAAILDGARTVV